MHRLKNGSTTSDLRENGLDRGRPDEWLAVRVAEGDVGVDRADEVRHAPEVAPPDALVGQLAEPALDEVEPGRARRREVEMEAGTGRRGEPLHHLGMGVRPVAVDDEMELQLGRVGPVEPSQEGQELLVAMTGVALSDDGSLDQVEGGEQRRRPVALVVGGEDATNT